MKQIKKQIGEKDFFTIRIAYYISIVLLVVVGIVFYQEIKVLAILAAGAGLCIIQMHFSLFVFLQNDGFLVVNLLRKKQRFRFDMYNGISKADIISRLTGNYLYINFSDGSSFQFLSSKKSEVVDAEIRELIYSLN
jgi:hypothetical protein